MAANGNGGYGNVYPIIWVAPSSTQVDHFTMQGSMITHPLEWGYTTVPYWFFGTFPNVLLVDGSQAAGFTFTIPIDDTHTATFRLVNSGTQLNWRPCVRIA